MANLECKITADHRVAVCASVQHTPHSTSMHYTALYCPAIRLSPLSLSQVNPTQLNSLVVSSTLSSIPSSSAISRSNVLSVLLLLLVRVRDTSLGVAVVCGREKRKVGVRECECEKRMKDSVRASV